jgi:biopolymer transport protein ExbD
MSPKRRIKSARFTIWLIPGMLISIGLHCAVAFFLASVPWYVFSFGRGGAPEPLELPWISTGWGWFIVCVTVGFTAAGIWLDRGRSKRIDPLARVALGLSVLGFAEAISGAMHMATTLCWPVNLIDVSIWLLVAAAALGVISWIRILLSKGTLRGWVFATSSVVCSAGYAWVVFTFLASYYAPAPAIELPVVAASSIDNPDPDEYRPELRIGLGGAEDLPDLTEIAARMKKRELRWPPDSPPVYLPDEPVLIHAAARASWRSVRDVIVEVGEAKIWKVQIAARWEEPPVQTLMRFYLPKDVGAPTADAEPPPPPHHLELHEDGRFSLDGEIIATLDALTEVLTQLYRQEWPDNLRVLWIDPGDTATWQEVLDVVVVSTEEGYFDIELDSILLQVKLY